MPACLTRRGRALRSPVPARPHRPSGGAPAKALAIGAALLLAAASVGACRGASELDAEAGPAASSTRGTAAATGDTRGADTSRPNATRTLATPPADLRPVEVTLAGFTVVPGSNPPKVTYGVTFKNPNDEWLAERVWAKVTFLDANGAKVGADTFITSELPAGVTSAAGRTVAATGASTISAAVAVGEWRKTSDQWPSLEVVDAQIDRTDPKASKLTGTLVSRAGTDLKNVVVVAVTVSGLAVTGGAATTIQTLPADTEREISLPAGYAVPPAVTAVKFFVIPAGENTTVPSRG